MFPIFSVNILGDPIFCHMLGAFAFEPSICRSLGTTFQYKTKQFGLPVYRYELDMGADLNVKYCFCRDEDTCPAKGTIDLFRCSGIPMIGSSPHFYLAEQLLDGIESGLNPNKDEHGVFINMEIVSYKNERHFECSVFTCQFNQKHVIVER